MRTAAFATYYVGYALLLLAFLSNLKETARRRDSGRLDTLAFLALLLLPELIRGPASGIADWLRIALLWLIPCALLRLVTHFRRVPLSVIAGSVVVGIAMTSCLRLVPEGSARALKTGGNVYVALTMLAVAALIVVEAGRSAGVKARRLRLAAAGTGLFAVTFVVFALFSSSFAASVAWVPLTRTLHGIAFVCYFLAFSTPRPLLSGWRRSEQAKYLTQALERDPDERGDHAADDLFQAAVRGVGGSVTLVALRAVRSGGAFVVKAASHADLVGSSVAADTGLIGWVVVSRRAVVGRPDECDAPLAARLAPHGVNVMVAPITAGGYTWGTVVVALRRGTLFPEDDLAMLAQIARNAATTLDHAQLLTDRRDHDRLDADRRMRALESRVELMLASIKDYAMFALDSQGYVASWHLGAEHVFGFSGEVIAGTSVAPLYGLTAAELATWLAEAKAWGHAERETSCVRRDESTFIGETTIRPLVEEPDGPPGFVVVTHDISDRRSLEERLRQGQKMEAIGQLAGGVAHDFNNLLTAILGYADWLEQGLIGDSRRDQVIEIQKAAERAAELTRQLLAFSRRQMLQPSAVNLRELVSDMLPMLKRLIGEQIEIVDQMAPSLSAVMGDRSQVEQIILNLVVNARDAMPRGGTITVRTSDVWFDEGSRSASGLAPGPHVLLEVLDTGVGMDDTTRQRAFEPFFTTKEVGRGTGLGLSTVYGIVQQMGGVVLVESTLNRGSTFRLWFPQASESAAAPAGVVVPVREKRGNETLLLVEDEDSVRRYLTHVLESHGYRVIAAEHPGSALSLLESFGERIDLVISDVVMPGSTGPELVRRLIKARPGLSALFISGYSDSALARHADDVDGGQILLKPFSSQELLTKIRQILAAA